MEKSMVKYDNHFNQTAKFNKLSQLEQDIFFSITSEFTRTGKMEVKITPSQITHRGKLNTYRPSQIVKVMEKVSAKMAEITFTVVTEKKTIIGPLFKMFTVDHETGETEIQLNDGFINYFSGIPFSFTQFELEKFIAIQSKYAKILFRCLLDMKNYAHAVDDETRYWTVKFDDFKKILLFPKSYKTSVIMEMVDKAIKEISTTQYIQDLKVTKTFSSGRGHPIESLTFTYKIQKFQKAIPEPEATNKPKKLFCPYCGKEVVGKNGANGKFYGHKYYKQTTCKHSWKTLEDFEEDCAAVKKQKEETERLKEAHKNDMAYLEAQRDKLFKEHGKE